MRKHCTINGIQIENTILISLQSCPSSRRILHLKYLINFNLFQDNFLITKYWKAWNHDKHCRRHSHYLRSWESECKCVEPNSQWRWIVIRLDRLDFIEKWDAVAQISMQMHFTPLLALSSRPPPLLRYNSTDMESHNIDISARSNF